MCKGDSWLFFIRNSLLGVSLMSMYFQKLNDYYVLAENIVE